MIVGSANSNLMINGCRIAFLLVNLLAELATFCSFGASPLPGPSVTLAWSANPSITIAGYRLYYGGESRTYTNMLDTGSSTSVTVPNLAVGATYFFAVTAYDITGLESPFSDEISYTVPSLAILGAQAVSPGQVVLSGNGPAGYGYEIQLSGDLQNWTAIGNVIMDPTGQFQFTDSGAATNQLGYYRLLQTSPIAQDRSVSRPLSR